MARLSGLASEHHPVGPGDAPRRKKGRKAAASTDMSLGTKRAASPPVESSQSKRKRVQVDDHDQLALEMEDSVSRSQSQATDNMIVAAESRTRRTRHHSEPAAARDDEDDSQITPPPATQPTSGLTPGRPRGRPSNAARRARMSMPPQIDVEAGESNSNNEYQFAPLSAVLDGRTRRRLRRSHVSEEVNHIEDHQKEDKKLREAYAELRRQLREKDEAITDLEFQLEARRLGNIKMDDSRAQELETQLTQAKAAIEDLRASSMYTGGSREPSAFESNFDGPDGEDDFADLDVRLGTQEMLDDEPLSLPNGEFASRALAMSSQVSVQSLTTITQTSYDVLAESTQTSLPDKISDQAVKRYDGEIERLIQQLGEAQGALRVIAIELQNLNVVEPGASSDVIITELRHGFEAVREQVENLLPGRTIGLTNSELLHKIPALLEGALTELAEKVVTSEKYYKKSRALQVQYESVLDLLSRSDTFNKALEEQNDYLEAGNAEKAQTIVELDERVVTLIQNTDAQDAVIKEQAAEINGLNDQVQDMDTDLARLRVSIENYRNDLDKVTTATMELEEQHRVTIVTMEQAHADTVRDLETKLEVEIEARDMAEGDAAQKSEYIDELEASIARIEEEVGVITDELNELRQRLADETELRLNVEAQRDEQTNITYDQANTMENLSEQIQDLETQLATFRANLDAERTQRAQTENALDEANQQIAELESDIHNHGIQANELRSKLFEIQQQKTQEIADLEEQAADRDAEQQALLDAEIQARLGAEDEVANYQTEVTQLEATIATLEDNISRMTHDRNQLEQDRDERVAALSGQLADLKQKHAALENSSSSTITTLQANITDLTNQVNAQAADIERITEEAAEMERFLRDEIGEKSETIANLEVALDTSTTENEKLAQANESLSRRVEQEAMDLLNIDAAHDEERKALTAVIETQNATIKTLQDTAAQRNIEHETAIAEKTLELEQMYMVGEARIEAITALTAQIEELKEAFRVAEEDTRRIIDTLTESQRQLQLQNEQLADDLKKRNAEALKAVQEMKVHGVEVHTNGVNLHKVATGKITKVSERVKVGKKMGKKKSRRQWDSGFGVDENVEGEGEEGAVEEGVYA
jgi:chromosome segregation ATPase